METTYGCKAFAGDVPENDALGWARLKAAGAILIGKTTTPDFGMLGVTNSSLTGFTNNPWNTGLTAGGSSGGAAASIAAGVAPIGWGSGRRRVNPCPGFGVWGSGFEVLALAHPR